MSVSRQGTEFPYKRKESGEESKVASYKAINGVMSELMEYLKRRLPAELESGPINAKVELFSSQRLAGNISGNVIGIFLYRVLVDSYGRNRYLTPGGSGPQTPQPELPVNLHFLLIVYGTDTQNEMDLLAWAMQQLSGSVTLDAGNLRDIDPQWGPEEAVKITPEDLSTEDLFRIWEVLKADYTVSVPYVAKTVRLLPDPPLDGHWPVKSRIFEAGGVDES